MNWIELNKTEGLLTLVVIVNDKSILEGVKDCAFGLQREMTKLNICIECVWDDETIENYSMAKNAAIKYVQTKYVIFVKDEEFLKSFYDQIWIGAIANCDDPKDIDRAFTYKYSFERIMMLNNSRLSGLCVSVNAIKQVGGFNDMLESAEDYELLLRLEEYSPFLDSLDYFVKFANFEIKPVYREDFVTYAYVLARYRKKLEQIKLLTSAVKRTEDWAKLFDQKELLNKSFSAFVDNDEKLLKQMGIKDPIVVIMDEDNLCLDVIEEFASRFYKAALNVGRGVILIKNKNKQWIEHAKNMHIRAILGFQSDIFADINSDEVNVNAIDCPKFMDIFDHPLYISYFLMFPVNDYYCLSPDMNYAKFAKTNFTSVKEGYSWWPGGSRVSGLSLDWKNKTYDLIFMGSFTNYRDYIRDLYNLKGEERYIANKMLQVLKKDPNKTFEVAYKETIDLVSREDEYLHDLYNDRKLTLVTMNHLWMVARIVTALYREKVIKALLDSNIELHVYGNSWKNKIFAKYENLKIHREVSYEEGLLEMAKSKISLNVFSWHKNCITERVLNSMFNMSLCISDDSKALHENFIDGEELVVFNLKNIDELPDKVRFYLNNDNERKRIIANAYKKVSKNHSWERRVEDLDNIINEVLGLDD